MVSKSTCDSNNIVSELRLETLLTDYARIVSNFSSTVSMIEDIVDRFNGNGSSSDGQLSGPAPEGLYDNFGYWNRRLEELNNRLEKMTSEF